MAFRNRNTKSNRKSGVRKFSKTSKMRRYKIVYDDHLQQNIAGFMKYVEFTPRLDSEDIIWEVEAGYEHRIDLISSRFYSTSKFDWLLEQINNIKDPIKDIKVGKRLIIPSKSRLYSLT